MADDSPYVIPGTPSPALVSSRLNKAQYFGHSSTTPIVLDLSSDDSNSSSSFPLVDINSNHPKSNLDQVMQTNGFNPHLTRPPLRNNNVAKSSNSEDISPFNKTICLNIKSENPQEIISNVKVREEYLNKCAKKKVVPASKECSQPKVKSHKGSGFAANTNDTINCNHQNNHELKRKLNSSLTSPTKKRFLGWTSSSDSSDDEDLYFNRCLLKARANKVNSQVESGSQSSRSGLLINGGDKKGKGCVTNKTSKSVCGRKGGHSKLSVAVPSCTSSYLFTSSQLGTSSATTTAATTAAAYCFSSRSSASNSGIQRSQSFGLPSPPKSSLFGPLPYSKAGSYLQKQCAQSLPSGVSTLSSGSPTKSPISPNAKRSVKIRPFIPTTKLSTDFISARHHSLMNQDANPSQAQPMLSSSQGVGGNYCLKPKTASATVSSFTAATSASPSPTKVQQSTNRSPLIPAKYKVSPSKIMMPVSSSSLLSYPSGSATVSSSSGTVASRPDSSSPSSTFVTSSSSATTAAASASNILPLSPGIVEHTANVLYKPRRVAHPNASIQRTQVRSVLPTTIISPIGMSSPNRIRAMVHGNHDNSISMTTMSPETQSALTRIQQLQDDEEVARALQEEMDREFAMSLQGSMGAGHSGAMGHTAAMGHTGAMGHSGAMGHTAAMGHTGAMGHSGAMGHTGAMGHSGAMGHTGAMGHSSAMGHTGAMCSPSRVEPLPATQHQPSPRGHRRNPRQPRGLPTSLRGMIEYEMNHEHIRSLEDLLADLTRRPIRARGGGRGRGGRRRSAATDGQDYEALLALGERLGEVKQQGLSSQEIAQLPIISCKKQTDSDAAEECNICMEVYDEGHQKRYLPCCHCFHVSCIDQWIMKQASCPICRVDIKINGNTP